MLIISILNSSYSNLTFDFERKYYLFQNKDIITSILASEEDISLYIKKDSKLFYSEIYHDENNKKMFIFSVN